MIKPFLAITAAFMIALLPCTSLGQHTNPNLGYQSCPDYAYICRNNNDVCEEDGYRDNLCNYYHTFSIPNNEYLLTRWNESVPFHGSERDSGTVDVSSAMVMARLDGVDTESSVDVSDTDYITLGVSCGNGEFVEPAESPDIYPDDDTLYIRWNVTDEFMRCSESFDAKLSEKDDVELNTLDLAVRYIVIPNLSVSITEPEEDLEIGKFDSFTVGAETVCEGPCGNYVVVALQYRKSSGTFSNVGPDSSLYTTDQNPRYCSFFHNNICYHDWDVHTSETGDYEFRVIAESINLDIEAVSDIFSADVFTGELTVSEVSFDPNPSEPGYQTTLQAEVSCNDYYCGEVRVYAKNGVSSIPSSGADITTDDDNPLISFINPGEPIPVFWELTPQISGEFPNIYVSVNPVDDEVGPAEGYPSVSLFVSVPSGGTLSVPEYSLEATEITEGGSTAAIGLIECNDGDCGNVHAYIQRNGENIPPSGDYPLTVPGNHHDCGYMGEDAQCEVSLEITGNEPGEYDNIRIYAQSDIEEIFSFSGDMELLVSMALGDILVSAEVNPQQINVSESTEVTSTVECSSEYCGFLTVSLLYDDGSLVGSGNLSTTDQNPFFCDTSSCNPGWIVTGNNVGLYELKVSVDSNETSVDVETDTMALYVSDPGEPPEPEFFISTVEDVSRVVGTLFSVSTDVICFGGNCGDTNVYLQYLDSESQWQTLTSSTPLSTPSNPFSFPLGQGDSQGVSWEVSPSVADSFSMRVVAQSTAAGESYVYFSAFISPPDVIAIEVMSPGQGETFSRGDEIPLGLRVTMNGEPVEGMFPTASASRELFSELLLSFDHASEEYRKSPVMHGTAGGDYTITFALDELSEEVEISVDPELDVSFSTDSDSYQTGELMSITGEVRKRGSPVDADAELEILCEGFSDTESIDVSNGEIVYGYILPSMPSSPCSLNLMVTDEYGNAGSAAAVIIVTKSPNDVYSLAIESPADGQVFTTGDAVDITVSVSTADDSPVEGAQVFCTDVHGNYNTNLSETTSPGRYSASPRAERLRDREEWRISCTATTTDGLFGSNHRKVLVKPVITIDVLSPTEATVEVGRTLQFRVQVLSDGMFLEDANVYMMTDDGVTTFLNYTANGKYEAEYLVQKGVQPTLEVFAYDSFQNSGSTIIELNPVSTTVVNWLGIGLAGTGVALLLGLLFLYRTEPGRRLLKGPDRRSVLSNKLKDLRKEESALDKAKESAEVEYYQRKITESEFREMMEDYEEDLLRVKAEIEEFMKELKSLKR